MKVSGEQSKSYEKLANELEDLKSLFAEITSDLNIANGKKEKDTCNHESHSRHIDQNNILSQFSRQQEILKTIEEATIAPTGGLLEICGLAAEMAAEILSIERASVWKFTNNATQLDCLALFELRDKQRERGYTIPQFDKNEEYSELKKKKFLCIPDARSSRGTKQFIKAYGKAIKIVSVWEVLISVSGQDYGVFRLEAVDKPRVWNVSEMHLISRVADKLAIVFLRDENVSLQQKLADSTGEIGRLREALDRVPSYIYMKDLKARYTYANKMTLNLFRCSLEELKDKDDSYFFPAANFEQITEIDKKVLTGENSSDEMNVVLDDGSRYVYLTVKTPLYSEDKQITGLLGISTDIAWQKQIEEALRLSENKFRNLVHDMQVGVLLQDSKAAIILSNPKALELLGLSEDQLLGKTSFDPDWNVIHEDGSPFPGEDHPVPQVIATGMPVRNIIMGVYHPLRQERLWLVVSAEPQFAPDGKVSTVVCTFIDISARRQAEDALQKSENRLQRAELVSKCGNWELHFDTQIMLVSQGAKAVYGLIGEQFNFADLKKFPLPEYRALMDKAMKLLIDRNEPYNVEFKIRHGITGETVDIHSVAEYDRERHIVFGIIQDITERKNVQEALRISEEKFRLMAENSSDIIWHMDSNSCIDYISPADKRLRGFEQDEVIGKHVWELFKPEDAELLKQSNQNRLQQEAKGIKTGSMRYELGQICKDGSFIWTEINVAPQHNEAGQLIGLHGVTRDITERKLAEEALRQSKERYRLIIEYSPLGVFSYTNEGILNTCNDNFISIMGSSKERLEGLDLFKLNDEEMISAVKQSLTGKIGIYDGVYLSVTGKKATPVHALFAPIRDKNNIISGGVGIVEDITERKKVEQELIQSQERFQTLLRIAPTALGVVDMEGRISFLNDRFINLFGYSLEDIPTITDWRLRAYPNAQERVENTNKWDADVASAVTNQGLVSPSEYKVTAKDGSLKFIDISAVVFGDEILVSFVDLTWRKKAEEIIRQSNQKLEQINSEKDKLISVIAHDLRSPFHGLINLSELLASEDERLVKQDRLRFSKDLYTSVLNIYNLLENLLEWAQFQRGTITFTPAVISLTEAFRQGAQALQQKALQKGVSIEDQIPDKLQVFADAKMVRSLFLNLLSNALKFSLPGGKITATVGASVNGMIEVAISDTGIGMPPEVISRLFKLGEKVGTKGTANEPSTGLGLLLCKEFVEKHGGKIWVKSQVADPETGQPGGSTFYFSLPLPD